MPGTGFRERLAYVRWLRARGQTVVENDTELAAELGVGYEWLKKWAKRSDAPPGLAHYDILAAALAPMGVSVDWLYDGTGAPPSPELWGLWCERMRDLGTEEIASVPAALPKRKKGRAKND